MMEHKDCNGRCPRGLEQGYCCRGCRNAQRAFYEQAPDEIKKHWTDQYGFFDPQHGCRLDRAVRPPECRDYNCADKIFLSGMALCNGRWPQIIRELDRRTATEDQFVEQARAVWKSMQDRAMLEEDTALSSWDAAVVHADGPTLYLLHGFLGSGKSTWARKFCERHPRARIVSADSYRQMLHGQYEYHAEMDPIIDASMLASIKELLGRGYDPVVDAGNLTRDRRQPFIECAKQAGAKQVVIVSMPVMHKDWYIVRRQRNPHRDDADWGKILEDERKAYQPIEAGECDHLIPVKCSEVTGRRILILTASPVRDKYIDGMIADKLRARGHTVKVAPCLREGRQIVLEYQPDTVLVPPIRNPNSRDFVEELKRFGCTVITRHTEPSCSWQDWKKMGPAARMEILGGHEYKVDLELVWSADEADILNRRNYGGRAVSVGAIGLDIYFDATLKDRMKKGPAFYEQYHLDPAQPTVLISSPWGFADSSPDLHTDDLTAARRDEKGRERHFAMVRRLRELTMGRWNILLSCHAGVNTAPYTQLAQELKIPLDAECPMLDMLPNCQALIHAGSTAAVSAHLLGIPAFQYGDVNAEGSTNWWGVGESAISRVSPRFDNVEALVEALIGQAGGSNANAETIKELQEGRYGVMDGKATDRAVDYIEQLPPGWFGYSWPRSPNDYRQLTIQRKQSEFFRALQCNVCGETFYVLTDDYVKQLATAAGCDVEKLRPKFGLCCPVCAARMVKI